MSQSLIDDPAEAALGLARPVEAGAGPEPARRVDVRRLLRFAVRRPGLLLAVVILVLVVLASFWPGLFTSRDPLKGVPSQNFRGPSGSHWFGTDELGRDVFSRVAHGAQLSLKATLIAVLVAFVVGIAGVAAFARVARAEVLRVRQAVFVEASRSCGARWYSVLGRHVLPGAAGPVVVLATLDFGASILAVSALSFLGYGAPPPARSGAR